MTNQTRSLLDAVAKGYTIQNEEPVYKNKVRSRHMLNGYYVVYIRDLSGFNRRVFIHRLVAFYKYGSKIFESGIVVRHLNGNPLDNSISNIAIGTAKDNSNDRDKGSMRRCAINASQSVIKHNHSEVIAAYKKLGTYEKVMKKLGITSKGTISFIINKSMAADNY